MKNLSRSNFIFGLFAFIGFCSIIMISAGHAQEKAKSAPPKIKMLKEENMKALLPSKTFIEKNEILSAFEGEWYFEAQYWSAKDADAEFSNGKINNHTIFGGKFMQSEINTIFNIGGENIPYNGMGFLGFNETSDKFSFSWLDSLHSGITNSSAEYDSETKTFNMNGSFSNPLFEKEQKYRAELQITAVDEYVLKIFVKNGSEAELQRLQINFRRDLNG